MKIVLIQNTLPVLSGAGKSNQIVLEGLAQLGHTCYLAAPATNGRGEPGDLEKALNKLGDPNRPFDTTAPNAATLTHHGVIYHIVYDFFHFPEYIGRLLRQTQPDWAIVSTEEPSAVLLQTALDALPNRVLLFAQTALHLPFGPGSYIRDAYKTGLLRRTACVITFSEFMRNYVEKWGQMKAAALPYMTYGSGPFERLGRFDKGFVTLINPCGLKGIPIFLALTDRFPTVDFAAVPTWGATEADLEALAQRPNITILPASPNIDDIFAQTRILLVPSLWHEAFGLVAVEAMLRGIPVIASNAGGLPEAKLGIDYLIPVNMIEQYARSNGPLQELDPLIPPQDIRPWAEALSRLLNEADHYAELSQLSYQTANSYVSGLDIREYERFLETLEPPEGASPRRQLSAEQRTLLAMRLLQGRGAVKPKEKQR